MRQLLMHIFCQEARFCRIPATSPEAASHKWANRSRSQTDQFMPGSSGASNRAGDGIQRRAISGPPKGG
ncbi:unnamed protein product [Protopolystoma xenopodis]|uniref:Uncharacterized protein n=1 Tax=Protopolystoma xenopodis TaxID=117903 RepID=A0A448WUI1_9PLAT|nr:unnamed protein product [Protopolystoma xenopodis]